MKSLGTLTLLLFSICSYAQHSTLRFTDAPINLNQQSLLLIPFESKMYLSDVNGALAKANNLSTEQIVERFAAAIDQSILHTFEEKCSVSSFYMLDDEESATDLAYVFDNRELVYELVSKTKEKTKTQKLKSKLKKKEDDSYHRGTISGGQIVTKRETRERYMKAVVKDTTVLDSMQSKFNNKYFLFVNQLDVMTFIDAQKMAQGGFEREIKWHYTLYHRNGSILSTGISRTTFPANQNNINEIIKSNFPLLAKQIFEDLFPPEEVIEKNKLGLKKWK